MEKKHLLITAVVCGVLALVIAASAAAETTNTPLYTVRMEQASSKMNFLPTEMNGFTYTAEKGYTVDYGTAGYCYGAVPLDTEGGDTCIQSCLGYTCTPGTCEASCDGWTCFGVTCGQSCGGIFTCSSYTCYQSCAGYTCYGRTCNYQSCHGWTCAFVTCWESCDGYTCGMGYTCWETCEFTCGETCSTCEGHGWTCNATGCQVTCSTCDQPTCPATCETCDTCDTCLGTICGDTCEGPECLP